MPLVCRFVRPGLEDEMNEAATRLFGPVPTSRRRKTEIGECRDNRQGFRYASRQPFSTLLSPTNSPNL